MAKKLYQIFTPEQRRLYLEWMVKNNITERERLNVQYDSEKKRLVLIPLDDETGYISFSILLSEKQERELFSETKEGREVLGYGYSIRRNEIGDQKLSHKKTATEDRLEELKDSIEFEQKILPLDKLKLWKDNPRTISKNELEALKSSITRKPYFIYARPIVLSDRTGELVIIAGNQRYKALLDLGWKEAPCIIFHCKTEEQEADIALTDNHNNGEWDVVALAENFGKFPLKDWLGSDWDKLAGELDKKEAKKLREVKPEPLPEEPQAKLGEMYQLGEHRLVIGDSTKQETLDTLLGGVEADMILTDPPYNVNYVGKTKDALKIANDNMKEGDYFDLIKSSFQVMSKKLKKGGVFYIWHSSTVQDIFSQALERAELFIHQQIIWVKNTFVLGRKDYQQQHEPCFTGWKDGAAHYFTDDRTLSTVIEQKPARLEDMDKKELVELIKKIYELPTTILREDKPTKNDQHPDMKPVNLFGKLIKNSSRRGEIVLDPFAGSGTTVIACEQLGRKAYVVEYDPRYADVIIGRWEKLTGEKARKI